MEADSAISQQKASGGNETIVKQDGDVVLNGISATVVEWTEKMIATSVQAGGVLIVVYCMCDLGEAK